MPGRLVVAAALLAIAGGACANQRLIATRAPYGVSDLVFVPDHKLEVQECDQPDASGNKLVWARMDVVFVPTWPALRAIDYQLIERANGRDVGEVKFPYQLRRLTNPDAADEALAERDRSSSPQGNLQQQIQAASEVSRPAISSEQWKCEVADGRQLSFDGKRLLGRHAVALVTAAGNLSTGHTYRLAFSIPQGDRARRAEQNPQLAPAPPIADGKQPETTFEVGSVELVSVKNNNYIGVPLGILLILGFLLITTL